MEPSQEVTLDNVTTDEAKEITEPRNPVDGELEAADVDEFPAGEQIPKKKKTSKSKKSSGKAKKAKPTGFEDFYADPPLTPEEFAEEHYDLYDPTRTFVERIETCIQRYRARRKLDEVRANIFNKYLTLGGVDASMKSFTGADPDMYDDASAQEIADMRAQDYIRGGSARYFDPEYAENWEVDFEGVAKGFLSQRAPELFSHAPIKVKGYCNVVRNFLNYVIAHGVCPEYTTNLLAAKEVCDLAEKTLPSVGYLTRELPGDFNYAAAVLYSNAYNNLDKYNDWYHPEDDETLDVRGRRKLNRGMTVSEAERVFKTGIAFAGTYEMFQAMNKEPTIVKKEMRCVEIISIVMPTEEKRKLYAGVTDSTGKTGSIRPLGTITVKHWDNPQAGEKDLTEEEEKVLKAEMKALGDTPIATFWLEDDILEHCSIGMKFEFLIYELDIGIQFFDWVQGVYPPFFTYLLTDRLEGWKEPKLNPRPAPCVGDADEDEGFDNFD